MPQLVFLWTDMLIFLLLGAIIAFAVYAFRHEHLRAPWRQVRQRPLAMSALVVLLTYVAVGLLDSVHLRLRLAGDDPQVIQYAPEIVSALDKLPVVGQPVERFLGNFKQAIKAGMHGGMLFEELVHFCHCLVNIGVDIV